VQARNYWGSTLIGLAALRGREGIVDLLLAHGADPNCRSSSDIARPLLATTETGRKSVVELLLANDRININ
jgi:hypothetical protein